MVGDNLSLTLGVVFSRVCRACADSVLRFNRFLALFSLLFAGETMLDETGLFEPDMSLSPSGVLIGMFSRTEFCSTLSRLSVILRVGVLFWIVFSGVPPDLSDGVPPDL